MELPENQITSKKIVGVYKTNKVFQLDFLGGLTVIAIANPEKEIAGTGSLPALARKVARTRFPGIKFTSLEKSEDVDDKYLEWLMPKYMELTETLNKMNRK